MPITKEVIVLYTDDGMGNSIGEIVGAVVRCKDCLEFKYCLHNEHNDPNGFCAWGERREDAETK